MGNIGIFLRKYTIIIKMGLSNLSTADESLNAGYFDWEILNSFWDLMNSFWIFQELLMLFMFCWLPIILEEGMLYQLLIWLLEFPACPWHLYPRSTQIQFWLCIWFQLSLPEQVSINWPYLVWCFDYILQQFITFFSV